MKTGKMETITLGLGGFIIVVSLVLFLFFRNNLAAGVWTNVLMAVGFALYIVYNVISASNSNQVIGSLKEQIATLEQDKEVLKSELEAKEKEVANLRKETADLKSQVASLQKQIAEQGEKIVALEASVATNAK
jgi:peptidoglycan hydrolase CwlO-like protein